MLRAFELAISFIFIFICCEQNIVYVYKNVLAFSTSIEELFSIFNFYRSTEPIFNLTRLKRSVNDRDFKVSICMNKYLNFPMTPPSPFLIPDDFFYLVLENVVNQEINSSHQTVSLWDEHLFNDHTMATVCIFKIDIKLLYRIK